MDDATFSNLLHLFLCVKLGLQNSAPAVLGQRRIMKKVVDTLTGKLTRPTHTNL
jgi:hypothetical protein